MRINISYDPIVDRILLQIRELGQPDPSHAIALFMVDIEDVCSNGPIQIDVPERREGERIITASSPWVLTKDERGNPLLRLEE